MVNTFLSDQTRSRISTIEVFNFHKDEGGYVVKEYWPTFPKDKDHEVHEANKDELEELLKIIEQGEEK